MSDTHNKANREDGSPAKSSSASETREFLTFLAKLAVFVFILRSFIIAPFNIPSESMLPRLLVGDYLVVSKWPYGYSRNSLPFSLPLIPDRLFASAPEPPCLRPRRKAAWITSSASSACLEIASKCAMGRFF